MALIRESLAAGHLLRSDPYAYTPTLPWIDHEWGAGAIAYFSTHWLGGRAILALKYFCALGTLAACIRCSEKRGADFRTIGICAPLAIFLGSLGFLSTVRAQDYSFLFTAIWLLFLEYDRRGSRIWIIPALAIFAIWVNLHAGFVVVLGLTAIHATENALRREPYRHLGLLLCAMGLEILVNPYGAAYFLYLKRALLMPRPYSAEWAGVTHLGAAWVVVYAAAILIAILAVGRPDGFKPKDCRIWPRPLRSRECTESCCRCLPSPGCAMCHRICKPRHLADGGGISPIAGGRS